MAEHVLRVHDGFDGRYLHVDDLVDMLGELAVVADRGPAGPMYRPLLERLADTFRKYGTDSVEVLVTEDGTTVDLAAEHEEEHPDG